MGGSVTVSCKEVERRGREQNLSAIFESGTTARCDWEGKNKTVRHSFAGGCFGHKLQCLPGAWDAKQSRQQAQPGARFGIIVLRGDLREVAARGGIETDEGIITRLECATECVAQSLWRRVGRGAKEVMQHGAANRRHQSVEAGAEVLLLGVNVAHIAPRRGCWEPREPRAQGVRDERGGDVGRKKSWRMLSRVREGLCYQDVLPARAAPVGEDGRGQFGQLTYKRGQCRAVKVGQPGGGVSLMHTHPGCGLGVCDVMEGRVDVTCAEGVEQCVVKPVARAGRTKSGENGRVHARALAGDWRDGRPLASIGRHAGVLFVAAGRVDGHANFCRRGAHVSVGDEPLFHFFARYVGEDFAINFQGGLQMLAALGDHLGVVSRVVDDVAILVRELIFAEDGADAVAPSAEGFHVGDDFWCGHKLKLHGEQKIQVGCRKFFDADFFLGGGHLSAGVCGTVRGLGLELEFLDPAHVVIALGIRCGEEAIAVEEGIRAGVEREGLEFARHFRAPRREAHFGTGEEDARRGYEADELQRRHGGLLRKRSAGDGHKHVDGHGLRRGVKAGEDLEHAQAVVLGLTHAEDAAAAHGDARRLNMGDSAQAIIESVCAHNAGVVLGRGVDVVVVSGEAGVFELAGGFLSQRAEGDAGFQAKGADAAHGFEHFGELGAIVRDAAPGGAHAEAGAAGLFGGAGVRLDLIGAHERRTLQIRGVMGGLGAVGAVLGAAAGLDGEEGAELDVVGAPVLAHHLAGTVEQFKKRRSVDGANLFNRALGGINGHGAFCARVRWMTILLGLPVHRKDSIISRARRGDMANTADGLPGFLFRGQEGGIFYGRRGRRPSHVCAKGMEDVFVSRAGCPRSLSGRVGVLAVLCRGAMLRIKVAALRF